MPVELKFAHIRSRLKKPSLDPDMLNNYRAESNLPFISKIIEKVVDTCLKQHLRENDLHELSQCAYRKQHSTETEIIKIQSDILQAHDSRRVAALLDLLAAFDIIDHSILIRCLEHTRGISGNALIWMASYLRERNQQVIIGHAASADVLLEYGVPHGSVLGPKLYSLYTQPLGDIIRHHQLDVHFYSDDTQLYIIQSTCENVVSAECMRVYNHKNQSLLAHHPCSEGATLASSPPPNTI